MPHYCNIYSNSETITERETEMKENQQLSPRKYQAPSAGDATS